MSCPSCGAPATGAGACELCSGWLPPARDPGWVVHEDARAAVLVTTGATLEPTHEIVEWRGIVFGESLLGGHEGEGWTPFEQKLQAGREHAIAQMRSACLAAGGNAIVAVQVGYEEIARTSLLIAAQGTAVVVALKADLDQAQPLSHGRSW